MSDIDIGSVWVNNSGYKASVTRVTSTCIEYQMIGGAGFQALTIPDFLSEFELLKNLRLVDSAEPKHSHYHKNVSGYDTIDVYVICDLYVNDNSGCIQHAVKKLLCCGNRGVKDNVKDLQEAIDTIQRKIEILQGKNEVGK